MIAPAYSCCAGSMEATLILSEQSSADIERIATGSGAADLASCDLGIFLFDSSSLRSLSEALQLLLSVTVAANNSLPCVMLAAKDDLGMSPVGRPTLLHLMRPGHGHSQCVVRCLSLTPCSVRSAAIYMVRDPNARPYNL